VVVVVVETMATKLGEAWRGSSGRVAEWEQWQQDGGWRMADGGWQMADGRLGQGCQCSRGLGQRSGHQLSAAESESTIGGAAAWDGWQQEVKRKAH
jgi:hypothetical protein